MRTPRETLIIAALAGLVWGVALTTYALRMQGERSGSTETAWAGRTDEPETNDGRLAWELDMVFADYEDGFLIFNERLHSGGLMTLPDGTAVRWSDLQDSARPFIEKGKVTVPHLFKWVMHENLAIRYIAIYALEEITGVGYRTPYYLVDADGSERTAAIARWKEWFIRESQRR